MNSRGVRSVKQASGHTGPNKMIMASLICALIGAAIGVFALGVDQGWWGQFPEQAPPAQERAPVDGDDA